MNASVLCLVLAVTAVTCTTLNFTTVPNTTHTETTLPPKTTHSQPTTAPSTTPTQPTAEPNTTRALPTTAVPETTRVPATTALPTPGRTTKSPAQTTAAAPGNSTANTTAGSTVLTTPFVPNTTVPQPETVIPSYQIKNGTEVCMLLVFNAVLKIKYKTNHNKSGEATIPIGGQFVQWNATGYCELIVPRIFMVRAQYPVPDSDAMGLASLDFQFGIFGRPPYGTIALVTGDWSYTEPFFPRDTVNYGKREFGAVQLEMGTMGNTFGCQTLRLTSEPLTILLDHVTIQPFADLTNGTFGDAVDECNANPTTMVPGTATPHPPTKPSPGNGGTIAGIVVGVLVLIALVVGGAVFVVRRRRLKAVAYGNIE